MPSYSSFPIIFLHNPCLPGKQKCIWFYQLAYAFQWPSHHCCFFFPHPECSLLSWSTTALSVGPLRGVLSSHISYDIHLCVCMYVPSCLWTHTHVPEAHGRTDRTQIRKLSKQGQKLTVSLTDSVILRFLVNPSRPRFPHLFYVYYRVWGVIK